MLLSKSAYARHMGVSRQTVYGWIARGEIVISGDKVDVDASQAKQNSAGARERQTEMTWELAAAWVWKHDGGKELPADIDAGQRIEAAAAELGFDVQHEPDEQLLILFRPDEETHSFYVRHFFMIMSKKKILGPYLLVFPLLILNFVIINIKI